MVPSVTWLKSCNLLLSLKDWCEFALFLFILPTNESGVTTRVSWLPVAFLSVRVLVDVLSLYREANSSRQTRNATFERWRMLERFLQLPSLPRWLFKTNTSPLVDDAADYRFYGLAGVCIGCLFLTNVRTSVLTLAMAAQALWPLICSVLCDFCGLSF